jgi:hypothetical protein
MFELQEQAQTSRVERAGASESKVGKMSLTEALGAASAPKQAAANDGDPDVGPAKPEVVRPAVAAPVAKPATEQAPAKPKAVPRLQLGKPKHGGEGATASGSVSGPATGAGDAGAAKEAPNTSGIKVEVAKKAAGNPSSSRTTVGVGEQVTFRTKGDGAWSAGSKGLGTGDNTLWTAPSTPGSVEISHTPTGGAPKKLTMTVLAPTALQFKHVGDFPVAPAGVGMTAQVIVLPTAVSFGNCEWQESPGPAEGASGYFAEVIKSGTGSLAHKPNKNWLPMGDANNAIEDHAWTSDNPKLEKDGQKRYWAGAFGWSIPNKYRVNGEGEGTVFTGVHQGFTMSEDGSVTVVKGGASATAKGDYSEPTGTLETYKTLGEAHAMLNRQGSRTKAIMAVMQYNLRADKDPESVKNLVAALKAEDIQLYLHVACENTFNYFSRDAVSLTAVGPKGAKPWNFIINNGKNTSTRIPLAELFDFAMMTPGAIQLNASVENGEKTFGMSLAFPFAGISSADAGSGGHYKLSAHLE